jgi:hypothetical protein
VRNNNVFSTPHDRYDDTIDCDDRIKCLDIDSDTSIPIIDELSRETTIRSIPLMVITSLNRTKMRRLYDESKIIAIFGKPFAYANHSIIERHLKSRYFLDTNISVSNDRLFHSKPVSDQSNKSTSIKNRSRSVSDAYALPNEIVSNLSHYDAKLSQSANLKHMNSEGSVHIKSRNTDPRSGSLPSSDLKKKQIENKKKRKIAGTLQYMSPEVLKYDSYGVGVDWWACGVAFYECVKRYFRQILVDPIGLILSLM